MKVGPEIVTDNLSFGYDTGYPSATNAQSLRFNKGEPTVNISSTHHASGHNSGNYGNVVTVADAPDKGDGWKKVTISNRGSNFRILQWTYTTHTSNVVYNHSAIFDWGNMRDKGYFLGFDGNGGGTRNYFRNGDESTNGGGTINSSLKDGKFSSNITKSGTHVHAWFINHSTTGVSGLNDYFYYNEYQVEINTHSTPYTSDTRSSTQGLLDLAGTADIDISNVSFDSNAQLSFDGTDDKIVIPADSYSNIGTDDFTVEVVFKNTKTSNYNHFFSVKDQYHFALKMQNTSNRNIYVYRSSALSTFEAITANAPSTTDYYHLVCKREGDKLELYLNGVSKGTKSGWGSIEINNDEFATSIGTHGTTSEFTGGEIPIVKLYNKSLTSAEITSNFNAYKNRFGI